MKVLFGLAAMAILVFVGVQIYDRQVQRNAIHRAQQEARDAETAAAKKIEMIQQAIMLAGHKCDAVQSIEAAGAEWRPDTFFVDCDGLPGYRSYAATFQGNEISVLKR